MPKSKKPRKATAKKHLQGKSAKRKAAKAKPAEKRTRRDGFTAVRKQKFLGALGRTGVVRDACKVAGISTTTAYRHCDKDPDFAAGWGRAHADSLPTLEATAFERAVEGIDEPIVRGDKIIGTRKKYSDPLLKDMIGRAAAAKARLAGDDPDILTRAEWENGLCFGENGDKIDLEERYWEARRELEEELAVMHARICDDPDCSDCRESKAA